MLWKEYKQRQPPSPAAGVVERGRNPQENMGNAMHEQTGEVSDADQMRTKRSTGNGCTFNMEFWNQAVNIQTGNNNRQDSSHSNIVKLLSPHGHPPNDLRNSIFGDRTIQQTSSGLALVNQDMWKRGWLWDALLIQKLGPPEVCLETDDLKRKCVAWHHSDISAGQCRPYSSGTGTTGDVK